jgi:hypothetical protein
VPLLPLTDIDAICELGVRRNLFEVRSMLLATIDRTFVAKLELSNFPHVQLRLDLYALNAASRLIGEDIPLRRWLNVAASHLSAFPADVEALQAYAARVVAQPEPDAAQAQQVASATLASLTSLSQEKTGVREALDSARDALGEIGKRLSLLVTQKRLHDVLHRLQIDWLPLIQVSIVRERFNDPAQQPMIADQVDRIRDAHIEALSELDNLQPQSREYRRQNSWIEQLRAIADAARLALQNRAFEPAEAAVIDLRRLIKLNMTQLNVLISYSLDDLELEELAGHLRTFAESSGKPDDPRTVQLRDAATLLLLLDEEIRQLVGAHDEWQRVDDEFWSAEDNLIIREETADNLSRFSLEWPNISNSIARLAGDPPADWYPRAAVFATNFLDKCPMPASSPVATEARDHFRSYMKATRNQFRQVDLELKGRCNRLAALTRPLQELGS